MVAPYRNPGDFKYRAAVRYMSTRDNHLEQASIAVPGLRHIITALADPMLLLQPCAQVAKLAPLRAKREIRQLILQPVVQQLTTMTAIDKGHSLAFQFRPRAISRCGLFQHPARNRQSGCLPLSFPFAAQLAAAGHLSAFSQGALFSLFAF